MVHAIPPRRLLRLARRAVWVVLGVFALYLVAMNVFLRTRLFKSAVGTKPEDLLVEYRSAYSIVPGRIHVDDVSVRGSDSHVEWVLRIDHCDFRVAFSELFRRRFHATWVEADGLSVRLRERLDPGEATAEHVTPLPPIDGFADPPLKKPGPPSPPPTDAEYHLWTIALDRVHAEHVREVWVNALRCSGDARLRGRWVLRPLRWLEIGPATVEARSIDVARGDTVLAREVAGRMDIELAGFDVRGVKLAGVAAHLSAHGGVHARAPTVEGLDALLRARGWRVSGRDADFDANVAIRGGVLERGSRVDIDGSPLALRGASFAAGASAHAQLEVTGEPAVGRIGLLADHGWIAVRGARADVGRVTASLETRELDVARPFGDATMRLKIEDLATDTLAQWTALLGQKPLFASPSPSASGRVRVDASLEGTLRELRARGEATVSAPRVALARRGLAIAGGVDARAQIASISLRGLDASATIALRNVAIDAGGIAEGGAGEAQSRSSKIAVRAPELQLTAPSVRVDRDGRAAVGTLHAAGRGVGLRVADTQIVGDAKVDITGHRRAGGVDLTGSRAWLRNVRAGKDTGWWANVELAKGTVEFAPAFQLRADARALARDVHPAASIVLSAANLPKWVADAFRMPRVAVQASVLATSSSITIRSLVARGEGGSVHAEYVSDHREKDGAALVQVGPLSVATTIAREPPAFVLVGAPDWYARYVESLRESAR